MGSDSLLTLENPVFSSYLFYVGILVLKVICMAPMTARYRIQKRIFITPEDVAMMPKAKVKHDDPDIERVRRAHYNDIENIPIFIITAFLYVATGPDYTIAVNLFRLFTVCRIVHTFVYAIFVIPQPTRALVFFGGHLTTTYMAVQIILSTL